MPYIDVVTGEDWVSLWYTTNTPSQTVGSFDTKKETILMLPPLFLDSTWLQLQMDDPRLSRGYNMIALDMRTQGRSRCSASGAHDSWVEAADIACAVKLLRLQPVHIFAVETLSVAAALRFAALFPEMCKSLTLVNVPPPTELEWVYSTYTELLQFWCFPHDLDEYEHSCMELSKFMLGKDCDMNLQDEIIAYWAMNHPPWRRSRIMETMNCLFNRTPMTQEELAAIRQPTLLIHADGTDINPVRYAHELAASLVNVEGGATVRTIKGSPEYVTVVPACATIVNRILTQFLARIASSSAYSAKQTPSSSTTTLSSPSVVPLSDPEVIARLKIPLPARLKEALDTLAEWARDEEISERNHRGPLSFSRATPEIVTAQLKAIQTYREGEENALSPLGPDSRPLRRFSHRYQRHWFHAEKDGMSTSLPLPASRQSLDSTDVVSAFDVLVERSEDHASARSARVMDHLPPAEPVSSAVAERGRARRSTVVAATARTVVVERAGVVGPALATALSPLMPGGVTVAGLSVQMPMQVSTVGRLMGRS